ncbi:hypothetical protein M0657_007260 [Pyricularia oryzae]|nr:hypothetical protein M0657_007260 [Pyricularia oryzae]KAI7922318.1 hypothetical protein M9X92_004901 [Pyricularia oryzae]
METVIFDESPLAAYLNVIPEDDAEEPPRSGRWTPPAEPEYNADTPPPSPPLPSFAPGGLPVVKKRFRQKPDPLHVQIPQSYTSPTSLRNRYSSAVTSRIDRADNAKFIEQFRYTVVASQLLSGHSILGAQHTLSGQGQEQVSGTGAGTPVVGEGLVLTVAGAFALAWIISWVRAGGFSHLTKQKLVVGLIVLLVFALVGHFLIRHRWQKYLREKTLTELNTFVSTSQHFDSAISAAVSLIQEVELVSRGYRISAPLPPVSRMDEKSQTRRCMRLRKALKACFGHCVPEYKQTMEVVKKFAAESDLEKYHDVYDLSDLDIADALQGFSTESMEDMESLHSFKIAAARLYTLRKMLLCALLALEVTGDNSDFLRWTTVVEGLRNLNETTSVSYMRVADILKDEESFPVIPTPKLPLSPGRERWRSQMRKLDSLSSGIRGLQAKMTLLREESDRALNEAEDVSEIGPSLMSQYDSIGQDLKILTQAWEEGRAALASGIDRNEKRLSSISNLLLSPTISLSGLTTVDEGGVAEALEALNGGSGSPCPNRKMSSPEAEVFEAIAMPRPRSLLTREERLAKMKADREKKAESRKSLENGRFMLRELETVLNVKNEQKSGVQHRKSASLGRTSL